MWTLSTLFYYIKIMGVLWADARKERSSLTHSWFQISFVSVFGISKSCAKKPVLNLSTAPNVI